MVRESRTLNAIRAAIDAIRAVGERSFTAYSGGLCFAAAHSIQGAGLQHVAVAYCMRWLVLSAVIVSGACFPCGGGARCRWK